MKLVERVKRDIRKEIREIPTHTGASWSDIILRNATRLTTLEDQKEFWRFLLDPEDEQDLNLTFKEIDPDNIKIRETYDVKVQTDDEKDSGETVTFENVVQQNGLVSYILSRPLS